MREKITWPGARIKKKEEGMPNYENNHVKGDLYITFDVEFPRGGLSDSEKDGRLWFVLTSPGLSMCSSIKYPYLFHGRGII